MGTKIYHPAKTEEQDQTGLILAGRHTDGRYQYRSVSLFRHRNIVTLTHAERVGLAVCKAIAFSARRRKTVIYPLTKSSSASGWGTYGSPQLWLQRSSLGAVGKLYAEKATGIRTHNCSAIDLLAHEMGHNVQRPGTKPHGPEFQAAFTKMRVEVNRVLAKGWPKIGRMQDSVAPHLRAKLAKVQRRQAAASESRTSKWSRALELAEKNLAAWERKHAAAERKVASYEKKVRHAQRFLDRAVEEEGAGA